MEWVQLFLTQSSGPTGYFLFFALIMACGCGFPMNSDLSLIAASVLAYSGIFQLVPLMILAFLALLAGDSVAFFLGRTFGYSLVRVKPFKWIFKPKALLKAEHYLKHHGNKFLFIVRFLPLIRTALFFTAGTLQVKPKTFYLMNGLASAIYVPALMGISYYTAENIEDVIQILKSIQYVLLALLLIAIAYLFFKKTNSKQPKELT